MVIDSASDGNTSIGPVNNVELSTTSGSPTKKNSDAVDDVEMSSPKTNTNVTSAVDSVELSSPKINTNRASTSAVDSTELLSMPDSQQQPVDHSTTTSSEDEEPCPKRFCFACCRQLSAAASATVTPPAQANPTDTEDAMSEKEEEFTAALRMPWVLECRTNEAM